MVKVSPATRCRPVVVLVRPRQQGNIGAVARAMANMGLDQLVLVEPAAEVGATARAFAVHAEFVLEQCRREPSLEVALRPFRRVIGTTSARGREGFTQVMDARALGPWLDAAPADTPTALVFGTEATGLTSAELACCNALVNIPCDARQPTLNLAQAVLLVAYELHRHRLEGEAPGEAMAVEPPATARELRGLLEHAASTLSAVGFARDASFAGVIQDLRSLAGRSGLTSREVRILRGICRRTERRLERLSVSGPGAPATEGPPV